MHVKFIHSYVCACVAPKKYIKTYDYDHAQFADEFIYVDCPACGRLGLLNGPDPRRLSDTYPAEYGAHSKRNFGLIGGVARRVAAWMKVRRITRYISLGGKVLEIGCGANPMATLLAVEPHRIYLVDHKITIPDLNKFNTFECDAIDFSETIGEKFKIIIFNQLIEHVADPERFVAACVSLLEPDGILYFETPDHAGYDARLSKRAGVWGGLHAPRHLIIFNRLGVELLMKKFERMRLIKTGALLNPFILNQTLRAIMLQRGFSRDFVRWLKLGNPVLLGLYLVLDCLFNGLVRLPTGNRYFIYEKR
ncbi:MAG: hypothetical protein RLZZ192_624 [Pseudomonadota bacterium]|jgi:SAM-dependent methyltransferase